MQSLLSSGSGGRRALTPLAQPGSSYFHPDQGGWPLSSMKGTTAQIPNDRCVSTPQGTLGWAVEQWGLSPTRTVLFPTSPHVESSQPKAASRAKILLGKHAPNRPRGAASQTPPSEKRVWSQRPSPEPAALCHTSKDPSFPRSRCKSAARASWQGCSPQHHKPAQPAALLSHPVEEAAVKAVETAGSSDAGSPLRKQQARKKLPK